MVAECWTLDQEVPSSNLWQCKKAVIFYTPLTSHNTSQFWDHTPPLSVLHDTTQSSVHIGGDMSSGVSVLSAKRYIISLCCESS